MKPGWKTSEAWLTLAAVILGALLAAHVFGDGSTAQRLIGAALAALSTLGYTAGRSYVKVNYDQPVEPSK